MDILFCLDPLSRNQPEPQFALEYEAAKELGFRCFLFDHDALNGDGVDTAFGKLPKAAGESILYRGWICTEKEYQSLYTHLEERGYRLVSSVAEYAEVNYFPSYYAKIEGHTPKAVWTESDDPYSAWSASRKLEPGPFVLKDHVKSAKHFWSEACFVPAGADRVTFEEIASNLKMYQGRRFERGFVVKEFVKLHEIPGGAMSYPQCEEYRLFFWKGKPLTSTHYHRQPERPLDLSPFVELATRFTSPFFSMDIARTASGEWVVIDMGAGEVSALPPRVDPKEFYSKLKDAG